MRREAWDEAREGVGRLYVESPGCRCLHETEPWHTRREIQENKKCNNKNAKAFLLGFYKQNICQAFSTRNASSEQTRTQEIQEMQKYKKCKTTRKQEMQHNICQGIKTIGSTNNIYAKACINHSYGPGVDTYSLIHHSYGLGVYMPRIFDKKCKPRKYKKYKKCTKSNACHKDTTNTEISKHQRLS